ncbi:hypothetical protein FH972_024147 [Carpinus fangiana]|uniref:Uncharacterized protein n=1 Tax=Carpinus fangiana TaxID=176857 RepID=A0A5N6KXJ3_9ROSI|nr:hypothetical protein FH972_024147 [Carpinus fangiana]
MSACRPLGRPNLKKQCRKSDLFCGRTREVLGGRAECGRAYPKMKAVARVRASDVWQGVAYRLENQSSRPFLPSRLRFVEIESRPSILAVGRALNNPSPELVDATGISARPRESLLAISPDAIPADICLWLW